MQCPVKFNRFYLLYLWHDLCDKNVEINVKKDLVNMIRKIPGVCLVQSKIDDIKSSTTARVLNARNNVIRGGVLLSAFGIIVWVAIFVYVVFYYTYIPATAHIRPVHLQFKACDYPDNAICTFPTAHVQLTRRQQLLMIGQRYRVSMNLEMPESEVNRALGMFMVCIDMRSREGVLTGHSCRTAVLHYRSPLLHALQTFAFAPFLVFGSSEEKQSVQVELLEEFEDDKEHPVTDIYVEIQSRRVEIYSARMVIHAHFSGIRYLMFNWPILSAIFGTGLILSTLLFVMGLSWQQIASNSVASRVTQELAERLKAFSDETDFQGSDGYKCEEYFEGSLSSSDDSGDENIEKIS